MLSQTAYGNTSENWLYENYDSGITVEENRKIIKRQIINSEHHQSALVIDAARILMPDTPVQRHDCRNNAVDLFRAFCLGAFLLSEIKRKILRSNLRPFLGKT